MSIRVECDSCGKAFSVADEAEGKRVKCKGCGEPVRVVRADDIEDEEPVSVPRSKGRASGRGKGKGKAKSGGSGVWIAVGGGAAVLVLAGVGLLLLMQRGGPAGNNPLAAAAAQNPAVAELQQHYRTLGDLAGQMRQVISSIRTAADVPATKAKALPLLDQSLATRRKILDIRASGQVPDATVQQLEDQLNAQMQGSMPSAAELQQKFLADPGLMSAWGAMSREMADKRSAWQQTLPPELRKLADPPASAADGEVEERLAKILPQGVDLRTVLSSQRHFANDVTAPRVLVLVMTAPGESWKTAVTERIHEIRDGIQLNPQAYSVTVDGQPQQTLVSFFRDVDRQEVLGLVDFGEVTAQDDETGVVAVKVNPDYAFQPGRGGQLRQVDQYMYDLVAKPLTPQYLKSPLTAAAICCFGLTSNEAKAYGPAIAKLVFGPDQPVDAVPDKKLLYLVTQFEQPLEDLYPVCERIGTVNMTYTPKYKDSRTIVVDVDLAKLPKPMP
jgi:hypothetical protein